MENPNATVRPKNWLVESILVTIFCCLPLGIVGIVNAANVNSRFDAGDFAGGLKASQEAAKWTKLGFWIGLGLNLLVVILYVVIVVLAVGAAAAGAAAAGADNY